MLPLNSNFVLPLNGESFSALGLNRAVSIFVCQSGFKSPGGTHLSEILESTSPGDNGNLE